jgi:hypothetical protein
VKRLETNDLSIQPRLEPSLRLVHLSFKHHCSTRVGCLLEPRLLDYYLSIYYYLLPGTVPQHCGNKEAGMQEEEGAGKNASVVHTLRQPLAHILFLSSSSSPRALFGILDFSDQHSVPVFLEGSQQKQE